MLEISTRSVLDTIESLIKEIVEQSPGGYYTILGPDYEPMSREDVCQDCRDYPTDMYTCDSKNETLFTARNYVNNRLMQLLNSLRPHM